jgi:hypothetical protein
MGQFIRRRISVAQRRVLGIGNDPRTSADNTGEFTAVGRVEKVATQPTGYEATRTRLYNNRIILGEFHGRFCILGDS